MIKTMKITYAGKIDKILDEKIISCFKKAGFKWYAQGFNLITNIRDICFDYIR